MKKIIDYTKNNKMKMKNKIKKAVCAVLMGRGGSQGFPGKNTYPLLGRPLMYYPMMAAKYSKTVTHRYFSTDSKNYKEIGRQNDWEIIDRPPELTTNEALGEDVYKHAYYVIKDKLAQEGYEIELLVLLMCNAPAILASTIDKGVMMLRKNRRLDSAVTVSCYNMWSPLRARKEDKQGLLKPFIPFEAFDNSKALNCDRNSQGDVWFADMGVSIIRPRCLDNLDKGLLPQKWMGQNIAPLKQWGGFDVDYSWQLPLAKHWLEEHGFTPYTTPYEPK